MIAVITSTIITTNTYSFFNDSERYDQTLNTIEKLRSAGFNKIFLFDNSLKDIHKSKITAQNLEIFHQPQYSFKNKGLNEALLLLNNLHYLPANVPIFKISGRYYPSQQFNIDDYKNYPKKDFIGVGEILNIKLPYFNTRAYYVKNKEVLESALVLAIEDMLSYSKGIHGPKSLLENIKPHIGTKYQLSIEQSLGRILKFNNNFHLLNKIGIEGYIAGSAYLEFISE